MVQSISFFFSPKDAWPIFAITNKEGEKSLGLHVLTGDTKNEMLGPS